MKLTSLFLVISLIAVGAMAHAQDKKHGGGPQCTPEPISMIGLGVAGLGLLRARMKKSA